MSYDLYFWREAPGQRLAPSAVVEALYLEQEIGGLLPFPPEEYVAAVMDAFPSAVRTENVHELLWTSDDSKSGFQLIWTSVHVEIHLTRVSTEDGNRLVEIGMGFKAPLYDPQTDERFDSWLAESPVQ